MVTQSYVKKAVLLCKQLETHRPDIIEQYSDRIQQLPVTFNYIVLLPRLLQSFCEFYSIKDTDIIGVDKGIEINELKRKFVAAMVFTYHPDMVTGHDTKVKGGLCSEIAFMLRLTREQISQYAAFAIDLLNPDKSHGMYVAFKREINEVVEYLKEKVGVNDDDAPQCGVLQFE